MTWFVCPHEQSCWYESEGRREEGKTEQAKQKQYTHLAVCLLIFSVNSGSTNNTGDENWALLLEEECDCAQVAAEDPAGRFGDTFTCSLESFVSLKSD